MYTNQLLKEPTQSHGKQGGRVRIRNKLEMKENRNSTQEQGRGKKTKTGVARKDRPKQ